MKNYLLISNIILVLLVGFLFYTSFKKKTTIQSQTGNDSIPKHLGANVAYIELDSLQSNYSYYKKIKSSMDQKQSASAAEMTNLQKRFQARATQLQQKSSSMNPQQQEAAMKEMQQMQSDLQTKKAQLDNDLYLYNSRMKEDILTRIQNYLKVYNKSGKYDYIFSYEPGFMFYKDSTLNITNDVITGLNELYNKEGK